VGSRSSLDVLQKKKISCPYWDENPGPSSLQPNQWEPHNIRNTYFVKVK